MSPISGVSGAHGHVFHPVKHVDYLPVEDQVEMDAFVRKTKVKTEQIRAYKSGKLAKLPDISLEELGFKRNLAKGTFATPRTAKEIEAVIKGFQDSKRLVLSMHVSAEYLDMMHTGASDYARHLHPSQPGLSTNSKEDLKKIHVVWEYKASKTGEIHPEQIKLTDGRLVAAWLADDEKNVDLREFSLHTARVMDKLGGNKHALDVSAWSRFWHGLAYRFLSYGRGIKEGLSGPRFNGSIGANLLVTSMAISAALYFVCYYLDYRMTKNALDGNHHALQALSQATTSGQTYSLNA